MPDHDEPTTVSAGPQRKLAAILAADVAGYSRLMERDEEDTHERLQVILTDVVRPSVERHRGRIFKTAGDGFLAEFASPIEAVRCAVDLQRATADRNKDIAQDRRLAFRMGINLGDVLADQEDIFGDGVNIAARLEAMAEPGGVLISHSVHEHVDRKLTVHFVDQGECVLKNIARPIRVFRVSWETADPASCGRPGYDPSSAGPELPQVASIAVLPFASLSNDAEQEYFADGLAEDLITDLSKVGGLLVIARHSSFAFRDRSMDLRAIARELGVRYLIEGSVRRAAARVRVNAQLIDASSASCLWAERMDRDLADIFALQDEVVGKVINALAHTLPSAKPLPRRRVTDLEAYDLFVRGRALATQSLRETMAARQLLARAIEIDPGFAGAHAWLAMSHHFDALYYEPMDEHRAAARAAAEKAVEIDPENADAHIVLGYLRAYEGEFEAGVVEFEQGLRLNPNHSAGWAHLADLRVFEGRATEAVECAENSFRLNPYPPGDHYSFLGWAQYAAGRYQDAVETLRHPNAGGPGSKRNLAAALARLGRTAEARTVGREFLSEFPNFSARQWGRTQPFRNDADRQHFIEGYIKAGLPE